MTEERFVSPRNEIEYMIASGDLRGLLRKTGELHGHYCRYSALGVKAGYRALKKLNVSQVTGMEHVLAIVETNNCFSDGIQIVTGCSFGNNSLIYRDFGKTAVTVLEKSSSRGVRITVRDGVDNLLNEKYAEERKLFEKVVIQRNRTKEDERKLMKLSKEVSFDILSIPDEKLFTMKTFMMRAPAGYSTILESVTCSKCGEEVMKTRAMKKGNQAFCIPCSNQSYYQMDWSGISLCGGSSEFKVPVIGYVKNQANKQTEKSEDEIQNSS
jgi:formylmethanofuran dehydrogenase subunit E